MDSRLLKEGTSVCVIKRLGITNMKMQASLKVWERLKIIIEMLDVRRSFYQTYESCVSYAKIQKTVVCIEG